MAQFDCTFVLSPRLLLRAAVQSSTQKIHDCYHHFFYLPIFFVSLYHRIYHILLFVLVIIILCGRHFRSPHDINKHCGDNNSMRTATGTAKLKFTASV